MEKNTDPNVKTQTQVTKEPSRDGDYKIGRAHV